MATLGHPFLHTAIKGHIYSGPELTSATLYPQILCVWGLLTFPAVLWSRCSIQMFYPMIETRKLRLRWCAPDHTQGKQSQNLNPGHLNPHVTQLSY